MAEENEMSEAVPAVAGIRNIGNTCYLNACLQAMASSPRLVHHVMSLAEAMKELQQRHDGRQARPSLAAQLVSKLQAAYRFLVEGPDDSDLSLEYLTARAAQGHLTQQLAEILAALQPQYTAAALHSHGNSSSAGSVRPPAAVDPGGLLSLLSWFTPDGMLERGLQHDAAEAFEAVMDAVMTELVCGGKCYNCDTSSGRGSGSSWADKQHLQAAGLKQLIQADAGADDQHIYWPATQQHKQQQQQHNPSVLQCDINRLMQHRGCCKQCKHPNDCGSSSSRSSSASHLSRAGPCTHTSQQEEHQQAQQHLLAGQLEYQALLHSRLPVVGHTLDLLTCLACGYRFPRSLTAFVCLPLPLPASLTASVGQLSVPAGADLDCCLRGYSQPEVVQGVECLGCSIRASLAAARAAENMCSNELHQESCPDNCTVTQQHCRQQQQGQQQIVAGSSDPAAVQRGASGVGLTDCKAQLHQQQLLARLAHLSSLSSPLPPLEYQQLLQQAGLPWVSCRTAVVKQTQLARAPPVLVLQLQRSMHTGGQLGKIQGHVRFPMQLSLSDYIHVDAQQQQKQRGDAVQDDVSEVQLLHESSTAGQRLAHQQAGECAEELQQQDAVCTQQQQHSHAYSRLQQLLYQCTAVIQHLGVGQASGHYIMYRRISVPKQQQQQHCQEEECERIAKGSSRSCCATGPQLVQHRWLRINDSSVQVVDEQEVLCCHATLLMYESLS